MSQLGRKSPPPPPRDLSEYDGHDDYRERFEPKPLVDRLQGALAVVLFFVVWFGAGAISSQLLIGNSRRGAEVFILGAIGWVIVGFGFAIVYTVLMSLERVRSQPALWFAFLAFGVILGLMGLRHW